MSRLFSRTTGDGGGLGVVFLVFLVACGLLAIDARPASALQPGGAIGRPLSGYTYPCALNGSFMCEAGAGPLPGHFEWNVGTSTSATCSFDVTQASEY